MTPVPWLEDVQAISAGLKDVTAIVGAGGSPSLPIVQTEPGSRSVKLQWALPARKSPQPRLAAGVGTLRRERSG